MSMVKRPDPAVAWSLAHVAGAFGAHGTVSAADATAGHGLEAISPPATVDHVSLPASNAENPLALPRRNSRALHTPDHGPKASRATPARAAMSVTPLLNRRSRRSWPPSSTRPPII